MTDTLSPHPATPSGHNEDSAHFKAYMVVFALLCVFTAVSFVVNHILGQNHTSMLIILGVAVVKALCVAMIFMHLKTDWGKVFFIVIPVSVMSVMMIIVLLPDIVLTWHHQPIEAQAALDSQVIPLNVQPKGTP